MWIKIKKQNQLSMQGSVVSIIKVLAPPRFSKLLEKLAKGSCLFKEFSI